MSSKKPFTLTQLKRQCTHYIPRLMQREPILALAHDGVTVRAALLDPREDFRVLRQAQSSSLSISAALDDIINALGEAPLRAVLATPTATLALLDLPVEPGQTRSTADMLGMVRWELEPLHAEQVTLWTLGNILVVRGILTREQRRELVDELGAQRGGAGNFAPSRLGDLAVEKGFATRDDIEIALAQQQQLVTLDEQVACAWASHHGENITQETPLWPATAMGLTTLGRWVAACESRGIRLEGIAPSVGCCSLVDSLINSSFKNAKHGLLLEIHPTGMTLCRLDGGQFTRFTYRPLGDQDPFDSALALLHEHLLPDDQDIRWLASLPESEVLRDDLAAATGRTLTAMAPDASLAAAIAAARRACGDTSALPLIAASEPPPPLWKVPAVWAVVTALLITLSIGGYEITAVTRQQMLERDAGFLHSKRAKVTQAQSRLSEGQQQAHQAEQAKIKVDAEIKTIQEELDFYTRQLGQRNTFLLETLDALSSTANELVLVQEVNETAWFEFSITGWSVTQEAGYRFARDLAQALTQWDMTVADISIRNKSARFGTEGFEVQFKLKRTPFAMRQQ